MLRKNQHFAFNVWDFESAKSVIDAAAALKQNVIIQTSAGIYKKLPAMIFSSFVKDYSASQGIKAWLNLDHCKEKDLLFHAVDHGWDMIMADGSSLPIMQNIAFTNVVTEYAHAHGVLVEAEVGQVKGVEDDLVVQQEVIASKNEIALFLSSTQVDFIAVAFGNAHGEYKFEPKLHYDLVEYTTSISNVPFVIHGGSGLSDEILKRLLSIHGVMKLNISTDLKLAYMAGIREAAKNQVQPSIAGDIIHEKIKQISMSKMKLVVYGGGRK